MEVGKNRGMTTTKKPMRLTPWNINRNINLWLEQHQEIQNANLSPEAKNHLFEMSEFHIQHTKPSKDKVFLQMAYAIATLSPDAETQVGAVIVNEHNHILSVGYNGFMPGVDDSLMPNIRPNKHGWILHAEENAILNCEHRPRGATIYVTHKPCIPCFRRCVASGITEVVYNNNSTTLSRDNDVEWEVALFLTRKLIKVRQIEPMEPMEPMESVDLDL